MTSRPQYPLDSGLSVSGPQDGGPDEQDGDEGTAPGGSIIARAPVPMDPGEVRRAVLAYLAVPFTLCLVPLAVCLTSLRNRRFARAHAAVALSLSVATMLYTASILIVGGVLALDPPRPARWPPWRCWCCSGPGCWSWWSARPARRAAARCTGCPDGCG